ncbi:MAG: DUF86 domain-containing protein [Nitrospirae bacterium]|nr:DUF86 domain-containing protein [Nitrospirota bacterium]MDA1303603.1 DUF86 domain-containing protein [Nitrospirota bacterium]
MPDDVLLNKVAIIERCLARIQDVYANNDKNLFEDVTKQDSIILNIQRACEASIDLAMHLVRKHGLGIPQESREAFALLETGDLLEGELAQRMKKMVGFRNVAVHDYTELSFDIIKAIITERLEDFSDFTKFALQLK